MTSPPGPSEQLLTNRIETRARSHASAGVSFADDDLDSKPSSAPSDGGRVSEKRAEDTQSKEAMMPATGSAK